jgi:hypothetical protein
MTPLLRRLALVPVLALALAPLHAQAQAAPSAHALPANAPCCGTITPEGHRLLVLLDSMDVEHKWLEHQHVDWLTGVSDRPASYHGPDMASHCSAFAAAVGYHLSVYLLRPPDHPMQLLASAQGEWLASKAAKDAGWTNITDITRVQHLANIGSLVVVDYVSPDPHTPGHIAVIRPSEKTAAELAQDGPEITQAGAINYNDYAAAKVFEHHPGAWPNEVRYYSHPVEWSSVPADPNATQATTH